MSRVKWRLVALAGLLPELTGLLVYGLTVHNGFGRFIELLKLDLLFPSLLTAFPFFVFAVVQHRVDDPPTRREEAIRSRQKAFAWAWVSGLVSATTINAGVWGAIALKAKGSSTAGIVYLFLPIVVWCVMLASYFIVCSATCQLRRNSR